MVGSLCALCRQNRANVFFFSSKFSGFLVFALWHTATRSLTQIKQRSSDIMMLVVVRTLLLATAVAAASAPPSLTLGNAADSGVTMPFAVRPADDGSVFKHTGFSTLSQPHFPPYPMHRARVLAATLAMPQRTLSTPNAGMAAPTRSALRLTLRAFDPAGNGWRLRWPPFCSLAAAALTLLILTTPRSLRALR